jgi:hypothetical protein
VISTIFALVLLSIQHQDNHYRHVILEWDFAMMNVGMDVVTQSVLANILSQVLDIVQISMMSIIVVVPIGGVEFSFN